MKSKWLTARETAAYLRVSERQLLRWRQAEIFEAGIHYRRKFPNVNSALLYQTTPRDVFTFTETTSRI